MSAPWLWITPLGSLVEPDVWTITMGSAGVTAASAAPSTSPPTVAAPASSPSTVQAGSTAVPGPRSPVERPGSSAERENAMRRSDGTVSERSGGGAARSSPAMPAVRLAG